MSSLKKTFIPDFVHTFFYEEVKESSSWFLAGSVVVLRIFVALALTLAWIRRSATRETRGNVTTDYIFQEPIKYDIARRE